MKVLRAAALLAAVSLGMSAAPAESSAGAATASSAAKKSEADAGCAGLTKARAALDRHSDGFYLDDDSASPGLLDALWRVAADCAAAYWQANPAAGTSEIDATLARAPTDMTAQSLRLDASRTLVSFGFGEIGTVFLIEREGDAVHVAWMLSDPSNPSAVARWQSRNANESCRQTELADRCGPMHAEIGALPAGRDGHPRFYVFGQYAQMAGATVGSQLSLWRWIDGKAEMLTERSYAVMIDHGGFVTLDGNTLRAEMKGEFKTFYTCGQCEGRQTEWTLAIGPDGIRDLGDTSKVPELDLADTLVERLIRHQATDDIADPSVAKVLAPLLEGVGLQDPGYLTLGMLMGTRLTGNGDGAELCLATDSAMGTVRFDIVRRADALYVAKAAGLGEAECGG